MSSIKPSIVHRIPEDPLDNKKIKVLTISDHPLSPSGVGTQTRYMIENMLKTGKYQFFSLAGAIKHKSYEPIKTDEFGDDWIVWPVDGYGSQEMIRSLLRSQKPDILWFMTDPRFFGWLWEIEDEIRPLVPMVYYHVWDNKPYPTFNEPAYSSNDMIVSISKVTNDIVKNVSPEVELRHVPHAVDYDIFCKKEDAEISEFVKEFITNTAISEDKFTVFWNNRNARRKQSGSLIFWFKDFLEKVGTDKAQLIMHTDPFDPHGQNLQSIVEKLGLTSGEVVFSTSKLPPEQLAKIYNFADVTINISDAEGFGLATLESLACETPIIATMTGGLQEQVTDGENWFGVGIEPSSKAIIGSQQIPWIYEDRVSGSDVVDALCKVYNMKPNEREELGKLGRNHALENYGFDQYVQLWDEILTEVHDKFGSWESRKGYSTWNLTEV